MRHGKQHNADPFEPDGPKFGTLRAKHSQALPKRDVTSSCFLYAKLSLRKVALMSLLYHLYPVTLHALLFVPTILLVTDP